MGKAIFWGKGAVYCKVWGRSSVSCAKTAEPMEVSFGLWAWVSQRNHVLDGVQIPTRDGTILRSKRGRPKTAGHVRRSIYS